MSEVKIVKVWIDTAATPVEVIESAGLVEVASGWNATLNEQGQTATFRVARMEAGQPRLTAVRSFSPPNAADPQVLTWVADGDDFVSPPLAHGYDFRLEIDTAAAPKVPVGGGHFRVVEEGGGGL